MISLEPTICLSAPEMVAQLEKPRRPQSDPQLESVLSYSKGFFETKRIDGALQMKSKPVGILKRATLLFPALLLYMYLNRITVEGPNTSVTLNKNDFQFCQNELDFFSKSPAYLDLLLPPSIDKFCQDYLISKKAYMFFLADEKTEPKKREPLSYWIEQVKPYFSFIEWIDERLVTLKKEYTWALTNCTQKVQWAKGQFIKMTLPGALLDWDTLCNWGFENLQGFCEAFSKMKEDCNRLKKIEADIHTLADKIRKKYQLNRCVQVFDEDEDEDLITVFENTFKQSICSKLPFSETSLCSYERRKT